jgi:hypothetical protein
VKVNFSIRGLLSHHIVDGEDIFKKGSALYAL